MRKLAVLALLVVAALGADPSVGSETTATRVAAGAGISVRLPRGWHLIRRRLTDVLEPAQRLAVASFPVRLASHACECGTPNIRDFPRAGAFLFVWESPAPSTPAGMRRVPPLPARFLVTQGNPHWYECAGPSWMTVFRDRGRVFQAEVYLGPAAGRTVREKMDGLLDSLQVAAPRPR